MNPVIETLMKIVDCLAEQDGMTERACYFCRK